MASSESPQTLTILVAATSDQGSNTARLSPGTYPAETCTNLIAKPCNDSLHAVRKPFDRQPSNSFTDTEGKERHYKVS